MKIIIRADMNKTIAMGHVMRCLSIADALKRQGCTVIFVNASDDPSELIRSRGYENRVLDTDFDNTIGEIDKFKIVLDEIKPDAIIYDGYYFSTDYFNKLKGYGISVYMDDYGLDAYPVDMLVNYNIYGDDTDYEGLYKNAGVKCPELLCGTEYAPLREAFLNAEPVKTKKEGKIEILVSTGGADLCGVAKEILVKYLDNPIENTRINVLAGPFSKDRDFILKCAEDYPDIVSEYERITDMPGFLSKFDIALSAAGSTSYELCRMGIPTCLFCSADNQSKINETFKKKGICESAGNAEEDKNGTVNRLLSFAEEYAKSFEKRKEMSEKMKKTVDAKGAERIAVKICFANELHLRLK